MAAVRSDILAAPFMDARTTHRFLPEPVSEEGVGPMSGLKPELIDAAFLPDGRRRALLLANLGYRADEAQPPRAPRLPFETAVRIL